MADVSKMVSDRVAISRTVLASLNVHGAEISEDLEKRLFPGGPPAHLTVAMVLTALGQALDHARTDLTTADLAHAAELADDETPRTARDQAIVELRARLISIRGTLSSVFGGGILTTYGLGGETPDDAELLVHRATNVKSLLADRPITEQPKQPGVTVNAAALAQSLQQPIADLTAALADVGREVREAQLTLKARNEAVGTWNAVYQGVADVVTGTFELVGRADLADLVRPTSRRRAGVAEPGDVTADPAKPA